jgi:hypothetical protein
MFDRFINKENAHRKGIYREALSLTRQGWYVMANHIPGFHIPPEIEGHIPDIYAVKDDQTYIIDLVMDGSNKDDVHTAHTGYAQFDHSTRYMCWMVDSAGCRKLQLA